MMLLCIVLGLVLFLNFYSFVLACIGVVLTIIYPFMKTFYSITSGRIGNRLEFRHSHGIYCQQ